MSKRKRFIPKSHRRSLLRVARSTLLLLAAVSLAHVHAQTDDENPAILPEGPLLRPAPSFAQWTVTYSYAEDRAPKGDQAIAPTPPAPDFVLARPRTVVTTKTRSIIREQVTDLQQRQHENWYVGTTQYRKDPGSALWAEIDYDAHPDIHYTPLPESGFRDLDWISAKTYTGKQSQNGRECLVFKTEQKVKSLDSALPMGKTLAFVAYLDAKTRLPFEVDIDTEIRTYQFGAAPSEMQNLPDDLVKQIKAGAAGRALMGQAAARPY